MRLDQASDLKRIIVDHLAESGVSRGAFAKAVGSSGELAEFSVVCLLSDAPVIGRRSPTIQSALTLCRHAGLALAVVGVGEAAPGEVSDG